MLYSGVFSFLFGWRGFLVGKRRGWHSHQTPHLLGFRGDALLGRPAGQALQLGGALTLLRGVFQGGSTLWGFSCGSSSFPGGVFWGEYRPGCLSNYFFSRLRRGRFGQKVRLLFWRSSPRGVKQRLSRRWGRVRSRGGLPGGVYRARPVRKVFLRGGYTRGVYPGPEGFTRGGDLLGGLARGLRRPGQPPRVGKFRFPRGGFRRIRHRGLQTEFARRAIQLQFRRVYPPRSETTTIRQAFRLGTPPGGAGPVRTYPDSPVMSGGVPRGRHRRRPHLRVFPRYQRRPPGFPGVILAGGASLLGGASLVGEAAGAAAPVIYFGGAEVSPRGVLFGVLWNPVGGSRRGIPRLVREVWGTTLTEGIFRLVWRRLSGVAELG